MHLKIVQAGNPVLRDIARPLTREEILSPHIQQLIELMRVTMHDAPGVGLAAPQVGLPIQLAVIEDAVEVHSPVAREILAERERENVPFHVIINPRISFDGDEMVEFFEGCLSVQGFTAMVARARRVRVECLNEQGEEVVINARGWYARILQHEIDHLYGTLYIDRMHTRTFMNTEGFGRYWKDFTIDEIHQRLQLPKLNAHDPMNPE